MPKRFRPDYEVLGRIGRAFMRNGSIEKKDLRLFSKISGAIFSRYMRWLESGNYIHRKDEVYTLTEEGKQMFEKLLKFLESVRPLVT